MKVTLVLDETYTSCVRWTWFSVGILALASLSGCLKSSPLDPVDRRSPGPSAHSESTSKVSSGSKLPSKTSLWILFIGNSLTYVNDLPAMLHALGSETGVSIKVSSVAFPDFSLGDHLEDRRALQAIGRSRWDYVVLQQGPSAQLVSRQDLMRRTRTFAEAIRKRGAHPVLFMVWPQKDRSFEFGAVADSYRTAARAVEGVLAPAGDVWRDSLERDPTIELYDNDGFHPTRAGTYAAALALYHALIGPVPRVAADPSVASRIVRSSIKMTRLQLQTLVDVANGAAETSPPANAIPERCLPATAQ